MVGPITVQTTLKLNGESVVHMDLRSAPGEKTRITNAIIDKRFYERVWKLPAEHAPDFQTVSDFSSTTTGLWDLD